MSGSTVWRASRLVLKGLAPRLHPTRDSEYAALIRDWEGDESFRQHVLDVAAGLDLRVLQVGRGGIILMPAPGSRFAMTAADYRANVKTEDRGLIALVQVAVAATFYPTAASLETLDRPVTTVTVQQIRETLVNLCQQAKAAGAGSAACLPAHLEEAWRAVLRKPQIPAERMEREADRPQRAAPGNLEGIIRIVLNTLVEAGMVAEEATADGDGFYVPLPRYQLQLRETAADDLFLLCHELATTARDGDADAAH